MFLAVALTSSLFATPLIATHLDFNHAHPEGTDHHVHAINAMLVRAVAAPVMSLTASMNVVATLVLLVAIVALGVSIDPANPARAPPLLLVDERNFRSLALDPPNGRRSPHPLA